MGKHEKPKEIPADKLAENMPPARKPNMASKLADLRAKYVARRDAQEAAQEKASDEFDRKIAALRAHESQTSHMDDLDERIRGWMTMAAERGGLPDGRLAEAFLRTTIP